VISARTADAEITAATRDFISQLEKKTGIKLKLYPESYTESECEIVVGMVHDRASAAAHQKEIGYTSWGLFVEGKKVIVTAYDAGGVRLALQEILTNLEEKDGKWVTQLAGETTGKPAHGAHTVPACVSESAYVTGIYTGIRDGIEVCLRAVKQTEYESYDKTLTEAGWVKYTENQMGDNAFATYTHENGKTLQLGYYPTLQNGTLRIVSTPTGYLPPTEAPAYTRVTDTTFTQIDRDAMNHNSAVGMSYIMQLADGSFIIIDGGPANVKDEDNLLAYLKSLTPAGQKPVIAAWFITHAHPDHMALANRFLIRFYDQVEIKMAAYSFPTYDTVKDAADVKKDRNKYEPMIEQFIESMREYWPDAKHLILQAGQRIYLADVEIEVFFTHADLYPLEFTWVNHTCASFRIKAGGKSIMILADSEKTLCQQMADTFGDYLKSDMLQLAHHGSNGACLDLYKRIDPDVCFWACSKTSYETNPKQLGTAEGFEFNAYIRDASIRVREHYHNSMTTVITLVEK
jgi:glyoxylase-like metal-dependent hydrolase (beta-lactamase superfamily II)